MPNLILPFVPAFTQLGSIASGAKLYGYESGTSVLATWYADGDLSTPLPNPVEANVNGRFPDIFLDDDVLYRVRLEDEDGALIDEVDPYTPGGFGQIEEPPNDGIAYLRKYKEWVAPGGPDGMDPRQILYYPGSIADGTTPNTQAFQDFFDGGGGRINWQAEPYVIDDELTVPDNTQVFVDEGVRIIWTGSAGVEPSGIFNLGSNIFFGSTGYGAEWTVEADGPTRTRWVMRSSAKQNIIISGLRAKDILHSYMASSSTSWATTITSGPTANIGRNMKIIGGGTTFETAASSTGSVVMLYCFDFEVRDMSNNNAPGSVQCWGGDANADGAIANERKCGRGVIRNISSNLAGGTSTFWIFTSMCRDVDVSDCLGFNAQDVGYDAEGCFRVSFRDCTGTDATNSVLATFFLNRSILFENCHAYSTSLSNSLGYFNNSTLTPQSRDITIRGCHFENTAGIRTNSFIFETHETVVIDGCNFINVPINFASINNNRIILSNINMRYTVEHGSAFTAITAGYVSTNANGRAGVECRNVSISSAAEQPVGSRGLRLVGGDFNDSTTFDVSTSRIYGFPNSIHCEWNSPNATVGFYFLNCNTLSGTITSENTGAGSITLRKNFNYDSSGNVIP